MDIFRFVKKTETKLKLVVLYFRRIIFARNYFKVSFWTKLKANLLGGYLADQWVLYDLNLKKRKLFLSEFDWYRSRYINEPFDHMLNNKVISTEVFKQYVRVPQLYAIYIRNTFFDMSSRIMSENDFLDMVREKRNCFIKPFGKGKGNGVERVSFRKEKFFINNEEVSEKELCDIVFRYDDFYVSEEVFQHEYAKGLYPLTTNTIRVITLREPESKKMKIFFAVQRVGTKHTIPVDNASKGGLVCKIDLASGRLSHAKSIQTSETYEIHPDSGCCFSDVCVPDWEEMKEEVLGLANRFPYLDFIAWDILKLEDGTNCIIEANTSSGVNIIQIWGGQKSGELGDFYRAHKVIR